MKQITKETGKLIGLNIRKVDPDAEIILFGSRARGEEREDSDWDILVLTDKSVDAQQEFSFRDLLYHLELELNQVFSVFFYAKNEWEDKGRFSPLYWNVKKEGISL